MRYINFLIVVLVVTASTDSFGQKAMTRSLSQTKQTKVTTTKTTLGAFGEIIKTENVMNKVEKTSEEQVRHFDLAEENVVAMPEAKSESEIIDASSNEDLMNVMVINERNSRNAAPPKSEAFLFHDAEIITHESGFYIQLIESAEILDKEHDIYQEFGNLRIKATIDGKFCYLIGSFKSKETSNDFLNNIILPRYPKAKVAEFKDGEKLQ